MNYSISRCIKPPGLFQRALTYYPEFKQNGFYLICLGKATVQPIVKGPLWQVGANDPAIFFEKRHEKEIQKNEKRLKNSRVLEMIKNKNCFFLLRENGSSFKIKVPADQSVQIKSTGAVNKLLFAIIHLEELLSPLN